MSKQRKSMQWLVSLVLVASASVLTGCGGQAYRGSGTDTVPGSQVSGGGGGTIPFPTGSGGTGSTGSTGGTTTPDDDFVPSVSHTFSLTGSGGTQPSVQLTGIGTDSILKVRITVGSAGSLSLPSGSSTTYSNFSASYNCASYQVAALGSTVRTSGLSLNGQCPSIVNGYLTYQTAPSSQIIDFSNRVGSGTSNATITISAPKYDYYCNLALACAQTYGNAATAQWAFNSGDSTAGTCIGLLQQPATYCSSSLYTVYKNHTITGTIEVMTNSN